MRLVRLLTLTTTALLATTPSRIDVYTSTQLGDMEAKLAARKTPFAGQDLQRYVNHYTMLAYRDATGSSELHEHEADTFFITSGETTIVLGGKLVESKATKPGEFRGTSISGGERRKLATGDIIHINAGVAHQMLLDPGKHVTYFVLKVTGE